MLLRRSKEAADHDRKEHGIEFDNYLEAINHEMYNDDKEANADSTLLRFNLRRITCFRLL